MNGGYNAEDVYPAVTEKSGVEYLFRAREDVKRGMMCWCFAQNEATVNAYMDMLQDGMAAVVDAMKFKKPFIVIPLDAMDDLYFPSKQGRVAKGVWIVHPRFLYEPPDCLMVNDEFWSRCPDVRKPEEKYKYLDTLFAERVSDSDDGEGVVTTLTDWHEQYGLHIIGVTNDVVPATAPIAAPAIRA